MDVVKKRKAHLLIKFFWCVHERKRGDSKLPRRRRHHTIRHLTIPPPTAQRNKQTHAETEEAVDF